MRIFAKMGVFGESWLFWPYFMVRGLAALTSAHLFVSAALPTEFVCVCLQARLCRRHFCWYRTRKDAANYLNALEVRVV